MPQYHMEPTEQLVQIGFSPYNLMGPWDQTKVNRHDSNSLYLLSCGRELLVHPGYPEPK